MNAINFCVPAEHISMLQELQKVPFAKTDDGYRFAYWVYDLNVNENDRERLLQSPCGKEAAKFLELAKLDLEKILVTEDDYLSWTVHKKEAGGIKQYHKALHDLIIHLIMLAVNTDVEKIVEEEHRDSNTSYEWFKFQADNGVKRVLNRNNPFADVTIKSQQFFYKTAEGETETLFFNTNNIVEKTEKNGQNMLTMRPGFTVSKEHGVVQRPMQKVTFANSITEPIIGDEDHIYVHID